MYYIAEDVETSVWFSFSNSSAIDIYSFISEKPSVYFIQAIENSEVLVLPKPALNKLYHEVPKMEGMMRRFWEDVVINLLERFNSLQNLSADQRYLDLLKKPGYMAKHPAKIPGLLYRYYTNFAKQGEKENCEGEIGVHRNIRTDDEKQIGEPKRWFNGKSYLWIIDDPFLLMDSLLHIN